MKPNSPSDSIELDVGFRRLLNQIQKDKTEKGQPPLVNNNDCVTSVSAMPPPTIVVMDEGLHLQTNETRSSCESECTELTVPDSVVAKKNVIYDTTD